MTEIDVTDKIEFLNKENEDGTLHPMIKCVCGFLFDYGLFQKSYDKKTRKAWECPSCRAKLYFRDIDEKRSKIVQVMDD